MPFKGHILYECPKCNKDIEVSSCVSEIVCSCSVKSAIDTPMQNYLKYLFEEDQEVRGEKLCNVKCVDVK